MQVNNSELLAKACERTISFVFAPNASSAANLYDAGLNACKARVAAVFLMADASAADEAVDAMRALGKKGRGPLVQAAEFDFSTIYGDDTSVNDFHLEQLPEDLLQVMRALSESMLDIYEYVLVIDVSQGAPSVEQIHELFQCDNNANSARSPYLLTRSCLDEI